MTIILVARGWIGSLALCESHTSTIVPAHDEKHQCLVGFIALLSLMYKYCIISNDSYSHVEQRRHKSMPVMKEPWLENVRVSKKAESIQIYRRLDAMFEGRLVLYTEYCYLYNHVDSNPK